MGRYQYEDGFREKFVERMRASRGTKCRMCNRPRWPNDKFKTCWRCGWLLCLRCQLIHRPERHDWKEGDPIDLTKCEMCGNTSEKLAPCTACLSMLCPHCRSLHKPEQHDIPYQKVVLTAQDSEEISRRTLARIGNPPHGEPPERLPFIADCSECEIWHQSFKTDIAEELKLYLREKEKIWLELCKDIMDDLGISEEEIDRGAWKGDFSPTNWEGTDIP
jgi:hypothetical protein